MNLRKLYLILLLISIQLKLLSQEVNIGDWREHYPYKQASTVCSDGYKIYCATDASVFSYDTRDNSIEKLTKAKGFSEIGKSKIAYNNNKKTLIIGYENGIVDLVRNDKIITVSDIKRANISGHKSINNIVCLNDLAYLSCGFGIVVLDLDKIEIKETYYIGSEGKSLFVNETTFDESFIYAATREGIYKARIGSKRLVDFNEWELLTNIEEQSGNYTNIIHFNDKIYTTLEYDYNSVIKHKQYILKDGNWKTDTTLDNAKHIFFEPINKNIIINYDNKFEVRDSSNKILFKSGLYEGWQTPSISKVIIDEKNHYWIADNKNGLIKMINERDIERISPKGPEKNDTYHFDIKNESMWIASGGLDPTLNNVWNHNGLMYLIDDKWGYLNGINSDAMDTIWDILEVNINPYQSNQIYASTHGYGLLEVKNNVIKTVYNNKNSTLRSKTGMSSEWVKTSSSVFDKSGNLWVANSEADSILSVKTTDDKWYSFYIPGTKSLNTGKMLITSNNHKWIILPKGKGIAVFSDNQTIENIDDDKYAILGFNEGNGNIPGNEIFSIKEDKDGYIWVGTDEGIAVFYNPYDVFDNQTMEAQQIKINQDGNVQLLLETESINCITIDGANRKWIGTQKGGVFLVSEDGTEQIYAFNSSNSPLPGNNIGNIAINEKNGEVYFGTNAGLISFKSTATEGQEFYKNVYAYPNPVRENYDGVIAIKGLVGNSEIKITDISGKLIYEGQSIGGQAIWNGRDFSGNKAKTGAYLVFASDQNGEKSMVTKLVFIE